MAGTPSRRERVATLVAQDHDVLADDFLVDDLQELRPALVMAGGVSLAVWMGGAALEFDRLLRCDDPAYLELMRLTRSTPRIDVIAGTSAGGLNGALLAYAITQETGVAGLRKLWLELGALEKLLRQPTADPVSLMRGDDYFLPQLDADHRGEFAFRRGAGPSDDDGAPDDDFADPNIVSQLALAARSTASFPIACRRARCGRVGRQGERAVPDGARGPDRVVAARRARTRIHRARAAGALGRPGQARDHHRGAVTRAR